MIHLSSGTGGTNVVGDGINVGHWNVGRWLVIIGSGGGVWVIIEVETAGVELTDADMQA
jgi:hypothetical protein